MSVSALAQNKAETTRPAPATGDPTRNGHFAPSPAPAAALSGSALTRPLQPLQHRLARLSRHGAAPTPDSPARPACYAEAGGPSPCISGSAGLRQAPAKAPDDSD